MSAENQLHDVRDLHANTGYAIGQYLYNLDGSHHCKRAFGLDRERTRYYYEQYPFEGGALTHETFETRDSANSYAGNLQTNSVERRYVRLPGSIDEAFG